jgi:signal transduction histidine kinase
MARVERHRTVASRSPVPQNPWCPVPAGHPAVSTSSTDLARLVEEHRALRRVATTIAEQASPADLFAVVAEEVAHAVDAPFTSLVRFSRGLATQVGVYGDLIPYAVGTSWQVDERSASGRVWHTGRAARVDYAEVPGEIAATLLSSAGLRSAVGAPILVGGRIWGAMLALSTDAAGLPADTEERLAAFTELVATAIANIQAREELRGLVDEQGALRRVATLVARGARPEEVFDAVGRETGLLVGATSVNLVHFTPDAVNETLAGWSLRGTHVPPGTRMPLAGDSINELIRQRRAPVRIESYVGAAGELPALLRRLGICSEVGAPVIIDGDVWGALIAGWDTPGPPPPGIELRVAGFAELVATAVANARSREEIDRLADEQAALRRVATLVARRASPDELFAAVAEEVGRVLHVEVADFWRYEDDGTITFLASWSAGDPVAFPGRFALDGVSVARLVKDTGRPARIDDYPAVYREAPGDVTRTFASLGIRAAVGCPVVVDGVTWGIMAICRLQGPPLPPDAERRLASFTELIGTAISNAEAESRLLASRARIVAAADEARRRIERDLHDGTQQQLVTLAIGLQELRGRIAAGAPGTLERLDRLATGLDAVLDDVREISRGLHPSLLSHSGLGPALRTLKRRSALPVELDVRLDGRLSEQLEIAAYYVVSEALANAAKHAGASFARVEVRVAGGSLQVAVRDDGRGGASLARGSGLVGLVDRVEALGGTLTLHSRAGEGTEVAIALPLA